MLDNYLSRVLITITVLSVAVGYILFKAVNIINKIVEVGTTYLP